MVVDPVGEARYDDADDTDAVVGEAAATATG
jgi:hypothetical protein